MSTNNFVLQLQQTMTEWNFSLFNSCNPDEIAFLRGNDNLFICFAFENGEWLFSVAWLCEGEERVTYFDYDDSRVLNELSAWLWIANEYKINFYELREAIYDNNTV